MKGIACDNNHLEAIDLTHCPELVQIWFSYNKIALVDLTHNTELKIAYFLGDMLTEVDFSGNPNLENIGVHENKLTHLDVSSLAKLQELHCGYNFLETLTLEDKPGLLKLYCYRNNLKELNLKGCPALNEPYSSGLRLVAGSTPVMWNFGGTLPEGLTFDAETGIISGIPTEAGRFRLSIMASNDGGTTRPRTVTLNVKGTPPRITTAKLPDAEVGKQYSATLTATGSSPITWTAENLPGELYLDGDTIKGIPSENGRARITVYASNPVRTVKKILTLKINLADITLPEIANNDNEAENVSGHAQTSLPGHESMTGNGALSLANDYVIVAVLPVISCDESRMYDFSVILSDYAPA